MEMIKAPMTSVMKPGSMSKIPAAIAKKRSVQVHRTTANPCKPMAKAVTPIDAGEYDLNNLGQRCG